MPKYDAFISYAWEDFGVAQELANALRKSGIEVAFSGFELKPGDSIRRFIDRGIIDSRYGIVIFSPSFLNLKKYWTEYELDGLVQSEVEGKKAILPIWLNVDVASVRRFSASLAMRMAIDWKEGLDRVVQLLLSVLRPVPKSQRRAALEQKIFDRMYHYQDATAAALRLVGANSEYFTTSDVSFALNNEPYLIPIKYRDKRNELVRRLLDEAKSKHKTIFDGPNTRMISYKISIPDPTTEKKALKFVLGPLGYFDYAIVRRLSDAAMEDDGDDQLEDFVDVPAITSGADISISTLSNIVDTATTVVTCDGYLLFMERGSQVSDRGGWNTCAVAENIQAVKDGIDFSSSDELFGLPWKTVARGTSEELSPTLTRLLDTIGWDGHLRMLGVSYDLEGFHPDLLFLLALPITHAEFRRIYREEPGVDSPIEGLVKSTELSEGTYDIVRKLTTQKWTPGGAASIIRTLEYLSAVSKENNVGSLRNAIEWILQTCRPQTDMS